MDDLLNDPLDADIRMTTTNSNDFCHYFNCTIITETKINKINKVILIKNLIEHLYFFI